MAIHVFWCLVVLLITASLILISLGVMQEKQNKNHLALLQVVSGMDWQITKVHPLVGRFFVVGEVTVAEVTDRELYNGLFLTQSQNRVAFLEIRPPKLGDARYRAELGRTGDIQKCKAKFFYQEGILHISVFQGRTCVLELLCS